MWWAVRNSQHGIKKNVSDHDSVLCLHLNTSFFLSKRNYCLHSLQYLIMCISIALKATCLFQVYMGSLVTRKYTLINRKSNYIKKSNYSKKVFPPHTIEFKDVTSMQFVAKLNTTIIVEYPSLPSYIMAIYDYSYVFQACLNLLLLLTDTNDLPFTVQSFQSVSMSRWTEGWQEQ